MEAASASNQGRARRPRWSPPLVVSLTESRVSAHRVWPCAAALRPHAIVITDVGAARAAGTEVKLRSNVTIRNTLQLAAVHLLFERCTHTLSLHQTRARQKKSLCSFSYATGRLHAMQPPPHSCQAPHASTWRAQGRVPCRAAWRGLPRASTPHEQHASQRATLFWPRSGGAWGINSDAGRVGVFRRVSASRPVFPLPYRRPAAQPVRCPESLGGGDTF